MKYIEQTNINSSQRIKNHSILSWKNNKPERSNSAKNIWENKSFGNIKENFKVIKHSESSNTSSWEE